MHPQELGAGNNLHCRVVVEKSYVDRLVLPEIDNDLLGLVNVQDQVVGSARVDQMAHLFSVGQLFIVPDEAHHSCVGCKLYDVIGHRS